MHFALTQVFSAFVTLSAAFASAQNGATLLVDATRASMRIIRSVETLPAKPGALTLQYAKWIPGEHMPSGPIQDLVGLHVYAGDREIEWKRDPLDMYGFRVVVPAGASSVRIEFDFVMPTAGGLFGSSVSSTEKLAVLDWYRHALFPRGADLEKLTVKASLRLPKGWQSGGSLVTERMAGDTVEYAPTSMALLFDHPVVLGQHYRRIELFPASSSEGEHVIDAIADSEWALKFPSARIESYRRLVQEERTLFGGVGHYERYHWLLTLSDGLESYGIEHHDCSVNRSAEKTFVDDEAAKRSADLLPHEFLHSWNGKYRRPKGLVNGGFERPMTDEGLWVYEGLTNYYGEVLAARSGLWNVGDYLDSLAADAHHMSGPGRRWRPLADTATSSVFLYMASRSWAGYRRSVDFYTEGSLIWLEVDTKIRELTKGARSLDDFCRRFHGDGENGKIALKPYEFEEVYSTLNEVAPYDWKALLQTRLDSKNEALPLGGVEAGGYRMVYNETPNPMSGGWVPNGGVGLEASIGLALDADGTVADAWPGSPAFEAGIAPGMKIVAVGGRKYTGELITKAITAAKTETAPIELLVDNGGFFNTVQVDYHGGLRYPHFVRIDGKDDVIAKILAPIAKK